jgi:hypothetical protein
VNALKERRGMNRATVAVANKNARHLDAATPWDRVPTSCIAGR